MELACAAPTVEGSADTALALVGIGQGEFRCLEGLSGFQGIGCVEVIDARDEGVAVVSAGIHPKFVVARPAEGSSDDAPSVLFGPTIEADHHLCAVVHACPYAVMVNDGLQSGRQRLFGHLAFLSPSSVEMGEPGPFLPQGHHAAGVLLQAHGLLLAIA